jgi:hypothetical protein
MNVCICCTVRPCLVKRFAHLGLHVGHPQLHSALDGHDVAELERLLLAADHAGDGLVPAPEHQRGAVVEQLEHVLLQDKATPGILYMQHRRP